MEIQYKSILILGDYPEEKSATSRKMIDMIVNYFYNTSVQEKGYQVSRVQIAKNVEEAGEYLSREVFDILYTMDMVAGAPVGVGKIKKWRELSPKTRIILMMKTESRGGKKVQGLYDIQYYDGCFFAGFNLRELNKLILLGRTAEMAQRYYGLQPALAEKPKEPEEENKEAAEQVHNPVPANKAEDGEKKEMPDEKKGNEKSEWKEDKKEQPEQKEEMPRKQRDVKENENHSEKRSALTFCEGRIVSVLSDKTVIIETAAPNRLKVGDVVAVPQLNN